MATRESVNLKRTSPQEHLNQDDGPKVDFQKQGIFQTWWTSNMRQRISTMQDVAAEHEISIPPAPQMFSSTAYFVYFACTLLFCHRNTNTEDS